MFDFMKKLNNKLSNSLNEDEVKVNNGVSYVANLELEEDIACWLAKNGLDMYSFGEVLLKIGFDQNKKLYLKKDVSSTGLTCYFSYDERLYNGERMTLTDGGGRFSNNAQIIIKDGNSSKYYRSALPIYGYGDGRFRMLKDREIVTKKTSDNITIVNEYFNCEMIVTIKKEDGIEIELRYYCGLEFNEDIELEQYLLSLNLEDDIFLVYKRIYEILSLNDESLFLKFKKGNKELASLQDYKSSSYGECSNITNFKIKDNHRNISYERYITTDRTIGFFGKSDDEEIDCVKVRVISGIYEFVLLVKPNNLDLDCISYYLREQKIRKYKLKNEIELRDYLLNLEYPIKIEEVFEKIREISLGDISKYSLINLNCIYLGKTKSSLCFKNGIFDFYKDNCDEREVFVTGDGKFTYKSNDREKSFFIDIVNDKIMKYEFVSKHGLSMNTEDRIEPLQMVINEVKQEKVKTKKLIDKIIK